MAVAAATLALSLLAAAPAGAKTMVCHHVEVTGPGIDGTLVVSPAEFGPVTNEHSPAGVVLDGLYSRFERDPRPSGSLGPRFVVTYVEEWDIADRELIRVSALLYPYADAGPVTFVLPDQRKDPFEPKRFTRGGWLPYPEPLIENLRAAGLPSPEAAERATQIDPSTAWPWALAGTGLALLLWVAGSGRGLRRSVAVGRI